MSWFGAERLTQFKNITGQISNFTKEVLSESTEEIDGKLHYVIGCKRNDLHLYEYIRKTHTIEGHGRFYLALNLLHVMMYCYQNFLL